MTEGNGTVDDQENSAERLNLSKLYEVWDKVVVGLDQRVEHGDSIDPGTVKSELYKSLAIRLPELVKTLGIDTSDHGNNLEYVRKIFSQACRVPSSGSPDGIGFSFFPSRILETKTANCAGNTLIVGSLLKSAGVNVLYGRPVGHSMSFVNDHGDMYWVDGANKKFKKVDYTEQQVDGVRVFKIDDPKIRYKIVPVFETEDIVLNILGNLEAVKRNARGEKRPETVDIMKKYGKELDQVDFGEWRGYLYPEYAEYWDKNQEFLAEKRRIEG